MGWWSKVKEATKKVATAVKNVVTATAKVITTARKIASPSLPTIITTASNILTSSRNTSTSTRIIQETTDKETAKTASEDIRKETEIIKEAKAEPLELKWWELLIKDAVGLDLSLLERIKLALGATGFLNSINALLSLFSGKDIDGNPREFEPTSDSFSLIIDTLMFIPIIRIGKLGTSLLKVTKLDDLSILASRLGEKKIAPEVVEELFSKGGADAIFAEARKFPVKFAKVITELAENVKSPILRGLSKQANPTAFRASVKALKEHAEREGMSTLEKVIGIIPGKTKTMKGVIASATLLGIIGSYIGYAGFVAWTGKEAIKDQVEFMGIWTAISEKDWKRAEALLPVWKTAIESYKHSTALTRIIPFISGIWKDAIEVTEIVYESTSEMIREKAAEVKIEPEEEKWERLRREAEEKRIEEIKAEEIRWERIKAEADERKRLARIEEQEYWTKLSEDAEIRREERKREDAEYWARIQEEARIAEEEKRILAEEYWAKVEEEKRIRREEEEAFWRERLAGPKKATITITSEPSNAEVYIDGEFKWTTTPYTILLPLGDHIIRVQKDGYFPVEAIIEIEEGDFAEIPFILDLIPVDEKPVEGYIPQTPYFREFEPAEPYIPSVITTPTDLIPSLKYDNLFPDVFPTLEFEPKAPPAEKELLINIETTDVKPWKGRIYSIAYHDLSISQGIPIVLTNDNERDLLIEFLAIFHSINPKKLLGFKLAFDHRYIFAKMMLYRIQSKKFKEIDLRDVKQIMDQVKEEFVYFPDKKGTLDDWGKMLLGKGKFGSQELMLRKYLAGDFEYVKAFQLRQLEITNGLYQLSRLVSSEALISPIPTTPVMPLTEIPSSTHEASNPTGEKPCKNCLAFNPLDASKCLVCSTEFKGGA